MRTERSGGNGIYARFCARAVFPSDRMSRCCPWRWIGPPPSLRIPQTAPEYNTSCFFITARALPATGPPVRLTGEGCAHGRGHHCSHLIFAGQEEQAQISFFFFSGSGQGWREAYYMRVCCPCPSFTSSCKSKPRPARNLAMVQPTPVGSNFRRRRELNLSAI